MTIRLPPEGLSLRDDLAVFATHMEEKLAKNDHKQERGTKDPLRVLLHRLEIEVIELRMALESETPEAAMAEAADVANFAMLIHKRLNHGSVPGAVQVSNYE